MDVKTISVSLTTEERAALYEVATRECRRPADQARFILRRALGIAEDQPMVLPENAKSGTTVRQDLVSATL